MARCRASRKWPRASCGRRSPATDFTVGTGGASRASTPVPPASGTNIRRSMRYCGPRMAVAGRGARPACCNGPIPARQTARPARPPCQTGTSRRWRKTATTACGPARMRDRSGNGAAASGRRPPILRSRTPSPPSCPRRTARCGSAPPAMASITRTARRWSILIPRTAGVNPLVRTLYLDPDGVLWIGTGGGGLSCLRAGKLTTFTAHEGLPEGTISRNPGG